MLLSACPGPGGSSVCDDKAVDAFTLRCIELRGDVGECYNVARRMHCEWKFEKAK